VIGWHELYALLKAAPRIVFSGDPAQLPPVQGDSVFRHMMAQLPHVELTKTWRFRSLDGPDVLHSRFPDTRSLLAAIKHMAVSLSGKGSMQVITPVNTGLLGVGHLNAMLRSVLNKTNSAPMAGGFILGDRVMVIRNVYVDGQILAANGQVGHVAGHENGMLWVDIKHRGPILLDAKDLTYAYCQTVHKTQGDQFENVIFVVPDKLDTKFLSDNLLLVGKTRGRNKTYVMSVDSSASGEASPVRAAGNQ
jgi:ATP-dependent exoDNAse (exonuclease V) alpha subunit